MTALEFIKDAYGILWNKVSDKVEKDCSDAIVKGYWAGTIIRFDIKPKAGEP